MNANIVKREKTSNGRYRYLILCLHCHKKKWIKESIIKSGNGKFCSVSCSRIYRRLHKEERIKVKKKKRLRCVVCKICLTERHNNFYGICYTLHRKGSNMCYICEINKLKKKGENEKADKLILEFRRRALSKFGDMKKDQIIKRIWG
ncbi:MAG: hypothetical protein BWX56_01277 [Euryarchaeota archaeon ADurb.Bin023]|nr:MAG: hypothetical protein BWX56_01277 [Euryarchaeota archaeon ADurb.Bin023]